MEGNNRLFAVPKSELIEYSSERRRSLKVLVIDAGDGWPGGGAGGSSPTAAKDQNGVLWFPTESGIAGVDANQIETNAPPPPVVMDRTLADKNVVVSAGQAAPGRGDLEFHYAALSLSAAEKVRFRYMLEGFDKKWIDAGSRRIAYYTNIPPGKYTFRVAACNFACDSEGFGLRRQPRSRSNCFPTSIRRIGFTDHARLNCW